MPGLAIALWAVALVFVFSLRIALHYRATGSTGILRAGHRRFSVPWVAAILFEASPYVMGAAAVIDATGDLRPIDPLDSEPLQIGAAILALAGMAFVIAAQTGMGREWRIGVADDQATSLVTGGLFALVRNPIYSGMLVAFGAIVLTDANPVALAGYLTFFLGIELQVRRVEEPYLIRAHGDEYRAYASRVGRFVPGAGLLDGSA